MTSKTVKFVGIAPGLTINDLALSGRFYESVLGLQKEYSNEAYAVFRRDGIGLHLTTNNKEKTAGSGFCTLLVEGVDEIYAEVLARQATVTRAIENSPYGLRDFVLADPDGNTILIGEPNKLSKE